MIGRDDILIEGIEYDSRRVKQGQLFAAVPGFKTDGRKFISDAIKGGAAAILTDGSFQTDTALVIVPDVRLGLSDIAAAFYGYPGRELEIIGVTGTNGKSTSVSLIRQILRQAGIKAGMLNSLIYDTGAAKYQADRTTPESLDVQRYLFEMRDAGCSHGVVEVSSHALVLSRVENIDFKVGLFTTFSRDHLDFHHTMEEYLAAKKLFLKKLEGEGKRIVINADAPEFVGFIPDAHNPVLTYSSAGNKADVMISEARLMPDKSVFNLVTPKGTSKVELGLLGRYNLSNAAGAAAVGLSMNIDLGVIVQALKEAEPVAGRFRPVKRGQPFTVIVDYAHTPDAIERLCQSSREITAGRVMILFGCGGDRDKGKRPLMGQIASAKSDLAVVTSDNPRTEDPHKIIDDILPGMTGNNYVIVPDRREAIREIIKRAKAGDTLLIAGKGAEDYQEIGTVKYPYDDTTEVIKALEERGYKG